MSGWASTAWGTYWAAGAAPGPYALAARAVATNVLRVRLDAAPKAFHASRWDDALNPANWSIARGDGGAVPTLLSIVAVAPPSYTSIPSGVSTVLPAAGLEFDLTFARPLLAGAAYDVTAGPNMGRA